MSKKRASETEIGVLKAQIALINKQQAMMDALCHPCCTFKNGSVRVCKKCKAEYDAIPGITIENFDEFNWGSRILYLAIYWGTPTWEHCKDIELANLIFNITTNKISRRHYYEMGKDKVKSLFKAKLRLRDKDFIITYDMLPLITEYMFVEGFDDFDIERLTKKIGKEMTVKWFASSEFSNLKNEWTPKLDLIRENRNK